MRQVEAGTQLVQAGAGGDEFFVMLVGRPRFGATARSAGSSKTGDHFGELAMLDPAPRSADVVMTSDGFVGVLSRTNFKLVLEAVPGVAPEMMAFLARRLRDADAGDANEQL